MSKVEVVILIKMSLEVDNLGCGEWNWSWLRRPERSLLINKLWNDAFATFINEQETKNINKLSMWLTFQSENPQFGMS